MIPHIFHWVWLGQNPLPEKDRGWMQSWRTHHPGWRFVVWAQHPELIDLEGFEARPLPPLVNQWSYDNIERYVHERSVIAARSDLIRYEVVLEGGVYLDTDVECFANIEARLDGVSLFVSDEWGQAQGNGGNYMFGAAPNHPAFYTVVRDLEFHIKSKKGVASVLDVTGPNYLNNQLWKYRDQLVVFPFMLFSPLCYWNDPAQVEVWPTVTLANHHADGKWYDRQKSPPPPQFLKGGHE